MANDINKAIDNVADTVKEHLHKGNAEAERASREMAGDEMTTSEKIESGGREFAERAKAEGDHLKRSVREAT